MVHCLVDEAGAFVRETECLDLGGRVDVPSWERARS
jgi:hypothetical protein